jgi:hypothetical protein
VIFYIVTRGATAGQIHHGQAAVGSRWKASSESMKVSICRLSAPLELLERGASLLQWTLPARLTEDFSDVSPPRSRRC